MEYQFSVFSLSALLLACLAVSLLFLRNYLFPNESINITLYYADTLQNQGRISLLPQLSQYYNPQFLFRFGIVSTLFFGVIGRFGRSQLNPKGRRQRVPLPDGTECIFDLYLDPIGKDPILENVIIVVLPGIFNHSNTDYVRAYIEYASYQGFKVVCYNHPGCVPGESVSSGAPRFLSYGGTGNFAAMMEFLVGAFPSARFVGVGLSLGANVLLKYLGEEPARQEHFLGAQSWCQGYDAGRCLRESDRFGFGTRLIYRIIAAKLKYRIRNSYLDKLFGNATKHSSVTYPVSKVHTYARVRDRKPGPIDRTRDENGYLLEGWEDIPTFDRKEFEKSGSMVLLDASFMLPLLGFKTLEELHDWSSSHSYMAQINSLPLLLVNARDDPLVPWWIAEEILGEYCRAVNDSAVGVMSEYGGHLGFYQESYFWPPRVSWLDQVSIQHAKSLVQLETNRSLIHSE